MAIKHSPGCTCCACPTASGSGVSYTAGTTYEIPYNLGTHKSLDLTNTFPSSLWQESNPWAKVEFKDSTGTTLHESIKVTPSGFNSVPVSFASSDGADETFSKPAGFFYNVRAFENTVDYELSDSTTYERNRQFKYQEPGGQFYRIKSVTAGTFNGTEGYARSLLKDFDPYYGNGDLYQDCNINKANIWFTPEKSQYFFFDSDTSIDVNFIRAHRENGDCNSLSPSVTWSGTGGLGSGSVSFSDNVHSQAVTMSTPTTAGGTFSMTSSSLGSTACSLGFSTVHNTSTISLSYIPIASATGDGHFQLECHEVQGIQGSTTDVRVIRTGGNSTAVDVVVAVGNTDVTLNFSAGDQYKSFTITHASHDGRSFASTPVPTNSKGGPQDIDAGKIVFRDDHWEYGSEDDTWHLKDGSAQQFWRWNPFERDGWTETDLSAAPIRAFLSMSHDGTFGQWSVSGLYMDGTTCNPYTTVNEDCPMHTPCVSVFPFHTQQYEIEVTLDAGYTNLSIPDKVGNLHEGCGSTVLYEADDPDILDYVWRWSQNYETVVVGALDGYETNYYASGHWAAQDYTVNLFSSCGNYTEDRIYSTYMPEGYVTFDSSSMWYANPTSGNQDAYFFTTTSTTTPSQISIGQNITAYSLTSIETTTESVGGWTTADGIKKVEGSLVDLAGTSEDSIPQLLVYLQSGYTNLSDINISGYLGTRVEMYDFNAAYVSAVYEKDQATSYSTSDVNIYIGQTAIPTINYKLGGFSFFGFQNNHPDLWYQVSGSASDDGYYRLYWNGTTTVQSGPHTTADDGSGNVWSVLEDAVPVRPVISLSYWYSDWTESDVTTKRANRLAAGFGEYYCDVIDDGYVRSVSGSGGGSTGVLSGTWISHEVEKEDVDYYVTTSAGNQLLTSFSVFTCDSIGFQWTPDDGARPDNPDGIQRDDFSDDMTFMLAESVGTVQLNDHPDSPASGLGWVFDGTPTRTTGTTVALDVFDPYTSVICNGNPFGGSSQTYSYWDYSTLTVWDKHVDGDANTNLARSYYFNTVVSSTGIGIGTDAQYGPSYAELRTYQINFRKKWLPCYNGMNFPINTSLVGDDDIDDLYHTTNGPVLADFNVMTACAISSPQWTQKNQLGIYSTAPAKYYRHTYTGSVSWETLDPVDFNMTINPYSPLWDKS